MTPELVGLALGALGILPEEMEDDGTFITFHSARLVEVMRALGGAGDHLVDSRVIVEDYGEGPEVNIEMPTISWSVAHAAYEAEERRRSADVAGFEALIESLQAEAMHVEAQPSLAIDATDFLASLGITEAAKTIPPPRPRLPRSRFARKDVV